MAVQPTGDDAEVSRREQQAIERMTESLHAEYAGRLSRDHVAGTVETIRHRYADRPIREFVPILVERTARKELRLYKTFRDEPNPELADDSPEPVAAGEDGAGDHRRPAEGTDLQNRTGRVGRRGLLVGGAAVVAAAVGGGAVVAWSRDAGPTPAAPPAAPTAVRGVAGSEKMAFFEDPDVVAVLARNGLTVDVNPAGSRQIATSVDLDDADFAFPGSSPAAEKIQRDRGVTGKHTPFSSPMAIATFEPIVELLVAAGVVQRGAVNTFDMGRYLDLVRAGTQWDDLPGNTVYPVDKHLLVSTTDPRSSNSAAMFASIAAYVANDHTVLRGRAAEEFVLPTVTRLFRTQGYTDSSSAGPFGEYLSAGMGPAPMVCIYESQFLEAAAAGRIRDDMVLMYPGPTVLSRHTLVPLTDAGDRLGRLLTVDAELQRLAARHGFRTADPAPFRTVAADSSASVAVDLVNVVDVPAYDTLERLLTGVAAAYS